jgi:hypothetical protein
MFCAAVVAVHERNENGLPFLCFPYFKPKRSICTLLGVEEVQLVFVLDEKTSKVLPNKIKQLKM